MNESFWCQTNSFFIYLELLALKLWKCLERRFHSSNGFHNSLAIVPDFFTNWTARIYGFINRPTLEAYGKIKRTNKEEQIFWANNSIDPLSQVPKRAIHGGLSVLFIVVWQTSAIIRKGFAQVDLDFFTLLSICRNWISSAEKRSNAEYQWYQESAHFGLMICLVNNIFYTEGVQYTHRGHDQGVLLFYSVDYCHLIFKAICQRKHLLFLA